MLIKDRAHRRPVELGPYPLEVLSRDPSVVAKEAARRHSATAGLPPAKTPMALAARRYADLFSSFAQGESAPSKACGTDDPALRACEVKAAAYYLDAAHVGIS